MSDQKQTDLITKIVERYPVLSGGNFWDNLKEDKHDEKTFSSEVFQFLTSYLTPEIYTSHFDVSMKLNIQLSTTEMANHELSRIQISDLAAKINCENYTSNITDQIFSRVRAMARSNNCKGYWCTWWDIEEYTTEYNMSLSSELRADFRNYFGKEVKYFTRYYRLIKAACIQYDYHMLNVKAITCYNDLEKELWSPLYIILLGSCNITEWVNRYISKFECIDLSPSPVPSPVIEVIQKTTDEKIEELELSGELLNLTEILKLFDDNYVTSRMKDIEDDTNNDIWGFTMIDHITA